MQPQQAFEHCPRCGAVRPRPWDDKVFECRACQFRYFFSASIAVAVFVRRGDGRVLMIRRAREPGKGRWAPPGGFVDIGETAERAAAREIREEVGLELEALEYLCSQVNHYPYAGLTYPVLDLFFTAQAIHPDRAAALDDVTGFSWLDPRLVDPAEMAFPSMQAALAFWQGRLTP